MDKNPNRIRELRLAKGWSQDRLAEEVGCSKMQISGLERGKPKLDLEWMRRLAAPLGVTPADLLPVEDNPRALSEDEWALIQQYRGADARGRDELQRVADVLLLFRAQPDNDGRDAA
ncbi:helix-turn-helix transcriptional regulator [Sphingopyxis granuli]|uniref:helix-turn-helix transcriptional regulator n=1 Tax=Sphingopyxis granuli TaxID=267128 RepID=UPI001BAE6147|nr:helix-turn-helix transcriptional regulator [Sphingopyxis granuli]QUM73322.1 helix-turn-helix transcriptional regulator [Sphingopyxis granuli]